MTWYAIDTGLERNPKFLALIAARGWSPASAIAHLHRFWSAVREHADDGLVTTWDDGFLARTMGVSHRKVRGLRDDMIRCGLLDLEADGVRVHNWTARNGRFRDARVRAQEARAASRAGRGKGSVEPGSDGVEPGSDRSGAEANPDHSAEHGETIPHSTGDAPPQSQQLAPVHQRMDRGQSAHHQMLHTDRTDRQTDRERETDTAAAPDPVPVIASNGIGAVPEPCPHGLRWSCTVCGPQPIPTAPRGGR